MNPNLIIALLAASAVQVMNLISQFSAGNMNADEVKAAWLNIIKNNAAALDEWDAAGNTDPAEKTS